jgi:sortase B
MRILVQITDKSMLFKVRQKMTSDYQNMLNTSIISDNELLFSDDYIKENKIIVTNYLNKLINDAGLNSVTIFNNDIASLIIPLFKDNENITSLILNDDQELTYDITKIILECHNLKYFNCYRMQDYLVDMFDKAGITTESRTEVLFTSNFMNTNNLKNLSSMYHKKAITLTLPLSDSDEQDFKSFCSINRYLKVIHVNKAILSDLELIYNILNKNRLRNIAVIIHDDVTDERVIEYLKKFNRTDAKSARIKFILNYSDDFLEKNLLPQTNLNILRLCCLFIIVIISCTFIYVFYDNYRSARGVEKVQSDIKNAAKLTDTKEIMDIINKKNQENATSKNESELKVVNTDIAALLAQNDETVGWLNVKNTNIDYAVTQASDNEYYLSHNFYKKNDYAGWIFMDYRNNSKILDDNTILYGHNRFYNGVMFGTLNNVLNKSWYTNEENLHITFNTLYGNMTWKIFSIYKTPVTTDYLTTKFNNDTDRLAFYQNLQSRSINDFGVNLKSSDKILTLSTCTVDNGRLVVHAVLEK